MFNTGDYVVYEALGVCRVTDIKRRSFPPMDERNYYVLDLVYGPSTTVYAPVDNSKLNIRPVLTADEVKELIRTMPQEPEITESDDDERRAQYKSIIASGDRTGLVRIIKTLYSRRENVPKGRKFPDADERIMKDAERMLYEEFALALDIKPSDVLGFIAESLEGASGAQTS